MTFGGVVFLLVLGGLIVAIVLTYNKLIGLRQRSEEAWSDIDVQLKRRTDLVPNLIETVKGYAAHERTTLDQVVRARGAAVTAQTQEARAQADEASLRQRLFVHSGVWSQHRISGLPFGNRTIRA